MGLRSSWTKLFCERRRNQSDRIQALRGIDSKFSFLTEQKTKEELAKEKGMVANLVTKIIDNLQASIKRIHVRVEHKDGAQTSHRDFSIGVTLEAIDFHTTTSSWEKTFIDRTIEANKNTPVFKLLKIQNLGVYYKTGETTFLEEKPAEDCEKALFQMFSLSDGKL